MKRSIAERCQLLAANRAMKSASPTMPTRSCRLSRMPTLLRTPYHYGTSFSTLLLLLHFSSLTYETVATGLLLPDSSGQLPATAIACTANGSANCSSPSMDETTCSSLGVCELRCPASSRSDFPKTEFPLIAETGWTKNFSSQCQINNSSSTISPPVGLNVSNGWFMINNTSVRCVVSSTSSLPTNGSLALAMWFYPNCSANCTMVYLGTTNSPALKVYLNRNSLCLNNNSFCYNASYNNWTHIVLQVQGGNITTAVNGIFISKLALNSLNLSSLTITFGLSEPYNGTDEYKLADVRYYNDTLTNREIQQIFSGKPLQEAGLLSSCRCPLTHPFLNSNNYTCQSENGTGSSNISRLEKIFHNASAILGVNNTLKWSGPDSKTFDLEVTLGYEYQVEVIEIQVASNNNNTQIEVNLPKGNNSRLQCNPNTFHTSFCRLNLTFNSSTIAPALFANHVTKTLTLHVQNFSRPLIISSIAVYGRCNCNGNADSCNITERPYTCICNSTSNTEGTHCDLCQRGFYSNNTSPAIGLGTCQPCGCNTNGIVANTSTNMSCNNTTGKCSCKMHVHGRACDECEDGYYNLKEGCLPCNCSVGSLSVTCNKNSGQCQCQGGTTANSLCAPMIARLTPNFGPMAGGTRVTVFGQLLGNNASQILIDNKELFIVERNWTVIIFETAPSNLSTEVKVKMQWNGTNDLIVGNFTYRSNPQLETNALLSGIKTFKSGGCTVRIQGSNFDSVAFPLFVINDTSTQSGSATGSCSKINQDLVCTTPAWHSSPANHRFGLRLDGLLNYSNIGPIQVHEDPQINYLSGYEVQLPFESTVKLTGSGFQQGCSQDDLQVLLGVVSCDIVKVTDTEIECKPPHNIQGASDVVVTVKFGSVIAKQIGTINFPHFSKSRYFIGIMCGIGGLILLIIVIIIIIKCRHRSHARPSRGDSDLGLVEKPAEPVRNENTYLDRGIIETTPNEYQPFSGIVNGTFLDTPIRAESVIREPKKVLPPTEKEVDLLNNLLTRVESSLCDSIRSAVVSASDLTQGRVCTNKGKYARIIDGQFATTTAGQRLEQKVTIKTLINPLPAEGLYPAWVNAALREVLRLHQHTDDNVLSIIGIALAPDRFHVVYPYMEHRTLKDNIMDIKKEFSVHQLLELGLQVADGLASLHVKGIVHRDLATRNCMVNHMEVVKISDAAFAWDFYSEEYLYDADRERYLPLRWLAPESLKDGYYSSHSDMWSFGVLLWELLTRAVCLPFHEMADGQVKDYVLAGYMLGKPENCPDRLYELMKGCWSQEIEHRPKIEEVLKQLENMLTDGADGQGDVYANLITEGYYENQAALGKASTKRKAPSPPK